MKAYLHRSIFKLQYKNFRTLCHRSQRYAKLDSKTKPNSTLTSKEIRKLFIDFFVKDNNHTYIRSSPVVLNNDPSLVYVNAGMNQFKPKLLNRISPSHSFYNLTSASNIQKCIRISGKHNDLADVGYDFYHHTFFEMMGNWSFGSYFKHETCAMAWELLTKVYGLPADMLYVTYFGGDERLGLPPDNECRDVWLNIGVPSTHVLPFGIKDNFWDMGDTGPCGPCTEIHYDYRGTPDAPSRVNAGTSDLIEVWNLVFIQYKREKDGTLNALPYVSIDTGMGLERLTAILQGTQSNYNTDLFKPIFQAIHKNFNIRPYEGKLEDEIDIAYRIVSDHARMFTVAISDGVFPDTSNAGHVLRKVIKRSAYVANRVLKSRPGVLSSVIPYIAETLDFYPEISKHINEVTSIVNEEEKSLHHNINRGRKLRNKLMESVSNNILNGKHIWELYHKFGLEENIIEDLLTEVNFKADWDAYREFSKKQEQNLAYSANNPINKNLPTNVLSTLTQRNIPLTNDSFKYFHSNENKSIGANIVAIVSDGSVVEDIESGKKCFIVTDETNFYSHAGGQIADIGSITSKSSSFIVEDVHVLNEYVFHEGKVIDGKVSLGDAVKMSVDENHRFGCARNHTATHLLNAALRNMLQYTAQKTSFVGPNCLKLGFSCKSLLSADDVSKIEDFVNSIVKESHAVASKQILLDDISGIPGVVLLCGEEYPENLTLITIGNDSTKSISVEPCCGTHVNNTSEIEQIIITNCKSHSSTVKILTAVTGEHARNATDKGCQMLKKVEDFKHRLKIHSEEANVKELDSLVKDVKKALHDCNVATDLPYEVAKACEHQLKDLNMKLATLTTENPTNEIPNNPTEKVYVSEAIQKFMETSDIPSTNDSYKYEYYTKDGLRALLPIEARICAAFHNDSFVHSISKGQHCILVLDKTNFYAKDCGQASDIGLITNKDCSIEITDVHCIGGYIYHEGWVKEGELSTNSTVSLLVNEDFRRNCSQNHTASHLLFSALRNIVPLASLQSSFCSDQALRMQFQSRKSLLLEELQTIEDMLNKSIKENVKVSRTVVPLSDLKKFSNLFLPPGEIFPDPVPVISIVGDDLNSTLTSTQPCCGTHAENTSELTKFVIITSKTISSSEKTIRAVCGSAADEVLRNGDIYDTDMLQLEKMVQESLDSPQPDYMGMLDLMREIKVAKNYHDVELPLIVFRKHQDQLTDLLKQITKCSNNFVQQGFVQVKSEVREILEKYENDKFIVHKLVTCGDGKKLINIALSSFQEKPVIFFAQDGHNTVVCTCSVPKNCLSSTLTALLWIEPVAAFLKGRSRFQSKDPAMYYSIESNDVHSIDEAMDIAKKYIQSCL